MTKVMNAFDIFESILSTKQQQGLVPVNMLPLYCLNDLLDNKTLIKVLCTPNKA